MNTFNKNQRRVLRGLMCVGLEREAGEMIRQLRRSLASARLGCDNLGVVLRTYQSLRDFEHHVRVDFDNVSSEARIFRVASLIHRGLLTADDLGELDQELTQSLNQMLEMFESVEGQ